MEIIDELEPVRRGVYAGAVGYFSYTGNTDTAIALRTLVVKNDRVYIQAGGGVVADSDPGAEFEESVNKARAMIRALGAAREFEAAGARRSALMKLLMIDNYDSFTYNLVQYLGELGAEVIVKRNDAIDVAGARALEARRDRDLARARALRPKPAFQCRSCANSPASCRCSASAWAINVSARLSAARSFARRA